jgi:hypothetical protein
VKQGGVCKEWGDSGGNLTNVQCKAIQNCHNESTTPYNEYILIKMREKKLIPDHKKNNNNKEDFESHFTN